MDREISAVFLDRDGVINVNRRDHVKNWKEFKFLPGALKALAQLTSAGLPVFVVTNQSVINNGLASERMVDEINERMIAEVARHGGRVESVLYCPHRAEDGCDCRKPRPGLLVAAARNYGLDLHRCYLVGDAITDIQAGQSVGCKTIMVLTGRGFEQHKIAENAGHNGYLLAHDLREATALILGRPGVQAELMGQGLRKVG